MLLSGVRLSYTLVYFASYSCNEVSIIASPHSLIGIDGWKVWSPFLALKPHN